jgi:hypothetical protein
MATEAMKEREEREKDYVPHYKQVYSPHVGLRDLFPPEVKKKMLSNKQEIA